MITPGCRVTLLVALPAHALPMGATGRVARVCNGWLDVRFFQRRTAGWVVVRGIDPAMVEEAT